MLLLILVFFFQTIHSNPIENGWKGIKALKTDKISAEKILGKPTFIGQPEKIGHAFHDYETEEATVQINYSTEPCKRNYGGRGDYVVPKDTVLEYHATFKKSIKLDDLKYAREKYTKSELIDQYTELRKEFFDYIYTNDEEGIEIKTKVRDGVEYIYQISFEPKIKNINYRECTSKMNSEIEKGWEGILPLKTDKAAVEKVLGKPTKESDYTSVYETEEADIRVKYSTEPCRKDIFGRGDYDVPKDTVFVYEIHLNKALKLADLKYNHKKFGLDPETGYEVANVDEGIYVLTRKRDNSEYVLAISFAPGLKYKNLKCKTMKE